MNRDRLPLSFLLALVAAGGCGGTSNPGNNNMPIDDMAMPMADLAKVLKPDMVNLGTDPVGAPCVDASNCGGNRPVCRKSLTEFMPALPAPTGYCSSEKCTKDTDCAQGGTCVNSGFCFSECTAKGECPMVNPDNICVNVAMGLNVCIPKAAGGCNPTDPMACDGSGACRRTAIDDAGQCMATCMLGTPCPAGAQGQAQACYFLTSRIDVMGKDTGDAMAALVCLDDASKGGGAPDSACMYLNSCAGGYECNFWKAGGADKVCKKLCHSGSSECVIGECTNAFLLKDFKMGDIGLCI